MSAFIVDPVSLAEIATGLDRLNTPAERATHKRAAAVLDFILEGGGKTIVGAVVREWADLNSRACVDRYGIEKSGKAWPHEDIDFTKGANEADIPPPALLKHLHCLHYQMSEGSVPDTDGYKQLDLLIKALEADIKERTGKEAQAHGHYQQTPWGNPIQPNLPL